jgi:hypothetical protein
VRDARVTGPRNGIDQFERNAGFFPYNAATGLVELVSIGPGAPATLLTSIVTNGATAFLIIMAMTFGLILPRMLFEHVLSARV